VLEAFEIGRKEAEDMIMSARVLAGWIKAEDLLPKEEPAEEAADGDGEGDGAKDAVAQG
jgi:N utilization substance protein A